MVATFLSRFLGIIRSRVVSACYGAGALTDAINFSFNIPNNARKLFAEGSLNAAYLPVFSRLNEEKDETERLLNTLITFQFCLFLPLILVTLFFSLPIVEFFSDFPLSWQNDTAASLLPFFTVFLFLISISSILSCVLETRHRFFVSASSPLAFSVAVILSILFFSDGLGAYAMALGTVAGAFMQGAVCFWALGTYHFRYRPCFRFGDSLFREVVSKWLPSTLTQFVAIISQNLTYYLASSLEEGAISAFSNAIIFYQTPYGIFFTAISKVYFPQFAATEDEGESKRLLLKSILYLYTFMLPSAIALSFLGKECISVLLETGSFTHENTIMAFSVLIYYMPAMILLSFVGIMQRYCYSKDKYYLTLAVSIVSAIVDFIATIAFIRMGHGASSISMAFIVSNALSVVMLFIGVGGMSAVHLLSGLLKITAANIPLLVFSIAFKSLGFDFSLGGSNLKNLISTAAVGCLMGLVTLVSYAIFKVDFLRFLKRAKPRKA